MPMMSVAMRYGIISAYNEGSGLGALVKRAFTVNKLRPKPLIIGIDPGLSGAIAVVDLDSNTLVDMIDMPLFEKPTESRVSGVFRYIDIQGLSSMIDTYAPHTSIAVLEEPGAMPGQGLGSTFRFGHICGQLHGLMAGHYIPTVPVKPGVWKGALGLTSDKDTSRVFASQLFPDYGYLWAKKKHNDRAEAALLTVYGKKYLKGVIEFSRK
jgi:crossover junction endodeoxyribonuclease RuvC